MHGEITNRPGAVSVLLSILIVVGLIGVAIPTASASLHEEENITSLSDSGWAGFGSDEKNTHRSPYDTSHVNGTVKWEFDMSNWVWSSAAISEDGTLYIGSTNGNIYALNSSNGDMLWSFQTGDGIISSPAIDQDGNIYVGSKDSYLYSLFPNGTLRWKYQTGGDIYSSPAISQTGNVYIGSDDSFFYAVSQDGELMWKYEANSWFWSSPAIADDGSVYVGSGDNNIYAFQSNGTLKWSFSTDNFVYSSPSIGPDNNIYTGSYDGKLYKIDPEGSEIWSYNTGDDIESSPSIDEAGNVYIGSNDKKLYSLYSNGTLRWSYKTQGKVVSSAALGKIDAIYFGSYDGKIYSLNRDGTERFTYDTGREIYSSPSIGPSGDVYVGSWDSNLYAFTGTTDTSTPPSADIEVWQEVDINLTIAGRPGNEITAEFYENGTLVKTLESRRTVGSPNSTISTMRVDQEENYTIKLIYNSTRKGANPVWVNISSGNGSWYRIFNNFIGEDEQELTLDISEEIFGTLGYTYHFSGANSYSPDSEIASYLWVFGDGYEASGVDVTHRYNTSGDHLVTLTVTDELGKSGSADYLLQIGGEQNGDQSEGDCDDEGANNGEQNKHKEQKQERKTERIQRLRDPMDILNFFKDHGDRTRLCYIHRAQRNIDIARIK